MLLVVVFTEWSLTVIWMLFVTDDGSASARLAAAFASRAACLASTAACSARTRSSLAWSAASLAAHGARSGRAASWYASSR
jgi:hypothetical protein